MKKLEKKIGISCEIRNKEVEIIYVVRFEGSIIETGKINLMTCLFNAEWLQDLTKSMLIRFEGFHILLDQSIFDKSHEKS